MELNIGELYSTDKDKEIDGVWHEIGFTTKGEPICFKIARFGGKNSAKLEQALAQYHKPFARLIESGKMPQETQDELLAKSLTDTLVQDWKGVKDQNDKEVKFTKQLCVETLTKYPDLMVEIQNFARNLNNFKPDEDLGNS